MNRVESLRADVQISAVRMHMQYPADGGQPQLVTTSRRAATGDFMETYRIREQQTTPSRYELDKARHIANEINTTLGPLVPIQETIDTPAWHEQERPALLHALHLFAGMCDRARARGLIKKDSDMGGITANFVGQYAVSSAILKWPSEIRRPDPGIFLHPKEIARWRLRFPEEAMSPSTFRFGLARVAARMHLAADFLPFLAESGLKPSQAMTAFLRGRSQANGGM